jgi:hypothetical protein
MRDSETFDLHRSWIPTALFKYIVQNIDVMQVQYGPPIQHKTEEARSQFLSPVSMGHSSDHQQTQTFTLRSLTILLLYLALLLGTCLKLQSRVILLPNTG